MHHVLPNRFLCDVLGDKALDFEEFQVALEGELAAPNVNPTKE